MFVTFRLSNNFIELESWRFTVWCRVFEVQWYCCHLGPLNRWTTVGYYNETRNFSKCTLAHVLLAKYYYFFFYMTSLSKQPALIAIVIAWRNYDIPPQIAWFCPTHLTYLLTCEQPSAFDLIKRSRTNRFQLYPSCALHACTTCTVGLAVLNSWKRFTHSFY